MAREFDNSGGDLGVINLLAAQIKSLELLNERSLMTFLNYTA
jgi:hypothetical protein